MKTVQLPDQNYPRLSSDGFLERAYMWLRSGEDIGLFYSALELRLCFESIWLGHGRASDNNSDSFYALNGYPTSMERELKKEFSGRIDLDKSYLFTHGRTNPDLTMGYFLAMPATSNLWVKRKMVCNFVHAQWAIPLGDAKRGWYKEKLADLQDLAHELIPHASPRNSLSTIFMPGIEIVEVDASQIEPILRRRKYNF